MSKSLGTISCVLCGGIHIYPGPRYEHHLIHEHGAVVNVDYLIKLSLFSKHNQTLPPIQQGQERCVESVEAGVQTDVSNVLDHTDDNVAINNNDDKDVANDKDKDVPSDHVSPLIKSEELELPIESTNGHLAEQESSEEVGGVYSEIEVDPSTMVMSTKEEVEENSDDFTATNHVFNATNYDDDDDDDEEDEDEDDEGDSRAVTKTATSGGGDCGKVLSRSSVEGRRWAPMSFSSTFTCYFCNETFSRDFKLKLHLMVAHKEASKEEMAKAKVELTRGKLDGCVHMCAMCGCRFNSVTNFARHLKDVHNMNRTQYKSEHGDSEIVSRSFTCEICGRTIKHTRNIIGSHMKSVHFISWKEYKDIVMKMQRGLSIEQDIPQQQMFHCQICGNNVKYKREHLSKKHQITENTYHLLMEKKSVGEEFELPQRTWTKCHICQRECINLKKHVEKVHKLSLNDYHKLTNEEDNSLNNKEEEEGDAATVRSADKTSTTLNSNMTSLDMSSSSVTPSSRLSNECSSSKPKRSSKVSATDLRCFFDCPETFKKDFQLFLHLKLNHSDSPQYEEAVEAAHEEIALTRRSGSVFECALCPLEAHFDGRPRYFDNSGSFYSHIQSKHRMRWTDYKAKYGRCEVASAPFECAICGRVIKHDRCTVHTHLKNVHGINWTTYVHRMRQLRRGEQPDSLPVMESVECRVCDSKVKYLKDHLRNVHKISENEYERLFALDTNKGNKDDENEEGEDDNDDEDEQTLPPEPEVRLESAADNDPEDVRSNSSLSTSIDESVCSFKKPCRTDIVDKSNKFCSSCNENFASRTDFIKHCAIVHNMRFRTKSGVAISADTFKRKEADAKEASHVASSNKSGNVKKGGTCDIQRTGGRASKQRLMEVDQSNEYAKSVKKAKMDLKCPFDQECELTFTRSAMLKRHLRDDHQVTDVCNTINRKEEDNKNDDQDNDEESTDASKRIPTLKVKLIRKSHDEGVSYEQEGLESGTSADD